jgi:hypothetical protein
MRNDQPQAVLALTSAAHKLRVRSPASWSVWEGAEVAGKALSDASTRLPSLPSNQQSNQATSPHSKLFLGRRQGVRPPAVGMLHHQALVRGAHPSFIADFPVLSEGRGSGTYSNYLPTYLPTWLNRTYHYF